LWPAAKAAGLSPLSWTVHLYFWYFFMATATLPARTVRSARRARGGP
jgi:hypothetical protein